MDSNSGNIIDIDFFALKANFEFGAKVEAKTIGTGGSDGN